MLRSIFIKYLLKATSVSNQHHFTMLVTQLKACRLQWGQIQCCCAVSAEHHRDPPCAVGTPPAGACARSGPRCAIHPGPAAVPDCHHPRAAVQPSDSGNSSQVWDFGQCGGAGDTCPLANKTLCSDSAYLPCANATFTCTRVSEWYWQVLLMCLVQ